MSPVTLNCPLSDCRTIEVTAPSGGYTAGQAVKIGDTVGFILREVEGYGLATLVYSCPDCSWPVASTASGAFLQGTKVYINNSSLLATASASSATLAARVVEAPATGSTLLRIALTGQIV